MLCFLCLVLCLFWTEGALFGFGKGLFRSLWATGFFAVFCGPDPLVEGDMLRGARRGPVCLPVCLLPAPLRGARQPAGAGLEGSRGQRAPAGALHRLAGQRGGTGDRAPIRQWRGEGRRVRDKHLSGKACG